MSASSDGPHDARDQRGGRPRGSGGRPGASARRDGTDRRPARDGAQQGGPRGHRPEARREARPDRPEEPGIDADVTFDQLDRQARGRLRTLSKNNAERVGQHLVMAGRLLDTDPETAYQHAQAAVRRAGRVDVVREAAALTAYATGRYAEALRELRTVRRLSGVDAHRAIEADCERGLGRPERALALVAEAPANLDPVEAAELAIVASGARLDQQEPEAALSVLERLDGTRLDPETQERVATARQTVLVALGRATAEPEPDGGVDAAADASDEAEDDLIEVTDTLDPS